VSAHIAAVLDGNTGADVLPLRRAH
jgi:hypothetical protein